MSTLGSIRKRSTLLLLVIGVAMLAFILGDFMQSKRSGGGGGFFVGEVMIISKGKANPQLVNEILKTKLK